MKASLLATVQQLDPMYVEAPLSSTDAARRAEQITRAWTADGRYVVFQSLATDLVTPPTNGKIGASASKI